MFKYPCLNCFQSVSISSLALNGVAPLPISWSCCSPSQKKDNILLPPPRPDCGRAHQQSPQASFPAVVTERPKLKQAAIVAETDSCDDFQNDTHTALCCSDRTKEPIIEMSIMLCDPSFSFHTVSLWSNWAPSSVAFYKRDWEGGPQHNRWIINWFVSYGPSKSPFTAQLPALFRTSPETTLAKRRGFLREWTVDFPDRTVYIVNLTSIKRMECFRKINVKLPFLYFFQVFFMFFTIFVLFF